MEERDFTPVAPKVAPRDRGPRRFVAFAYLVIGGVIAYDRKQVTAVDAG